jgi:hypothetical protein
MRRSNCWKRLSRSIRGTPRRTIAWLSYYRKPENEKKLKSISRFFRNIETRDGPGYFLAFCTYSLRRGFVGVGFTFYRST